MSNLQLHALSWWLLLLFNLGRLAICFQQSCSLLLVSTELAHQSLPPALNAQAILFDAQKRHPCLSVADWPYAHQSAIDASLRSRH